MTTSLRDPRVEELADAVFHAERRHRRLLTEAKSTSAAKSEDAWERAWRMADEAYEKFCAAVWALADRDR